MYIQDTIYMEGCVVSLVLISSFAERLKEALENTTTTEFADAVGVSKQTISAYTTGVRKPKSPTIKVMADILKVNASWLLGYDVSKNANSDDNTSYFKEKGSDSKYQLYHDEDTLISIYRSFNDEGKRKTIEYLQDLELSGKYKKEKSEFFNPNNSDNE